ncbi:MAG TPA: hypothetical protein VHN14_12785 [Kofleriaceae bacterium]|nr:hypothetical protein [Kofleriaceae bacterium]
MALLCAGAFVVLNIVFYVLSGSYFDSHRTVVPGVGSVSSYSPEQMTHIRMTFAVSSGIVAVLAFIAGIRPRVIGHLLPVLFGAANLVSAVETYLHDLPGVLVATTLIAGALMLVLAWYSYYRRSRPAWAFLLAFCVVFGTIEFFGITKIRGALDVGLWSAMISPMLKWLTVATLWSLRDEYAETDPATV